jgi:hypothetical protein
MQSEHRSHGCSTGIVARILVRKPSNLIGLLAVTSDFSVLYSTAVGSVAHTQVAFTRSNIYSLCAPSAMLPTMSKLKTALIYLQILPVPFQDVTRNEAQGENYEPVILSKM